MWFCLNSFTFPYASSLAVPRACRSLRGDLGGADIMICRYAQRLKDAQSFLLVLCTLFSIFFLDLHYPSLFRMYSVGIFAVEVAVLIQVQGWNMLECKRSIDPIEIDSSFGFGHIIVVICSDHDVFFCHGRLLCSERLANLINRYQ